MKTLFFRYVAVLGLAVFCMVPLAKATTGGGGGNPGGGGGIGQQTCYSTYNPCSIGCDSTLVCEGGGECSRQKVDSKSDKGTC